MKCGRRKCATPVIKDKTRKENPGKSRRDSAAEISRRLPKRRTANICGRWSGIVFFWIGRRVDFASRGVYLRPVVRNRLFLDWMARQFFQSRRIFATGNTKSIFRATGAPVVKGAATNRDRESEIRRAPPDLPLFAHETYHNTI